MVMSVLRLLNPSKLEVKLKYVRPKNIRATHPRRSRYDSDESKGRSVRSQSPLPFNSKGRARIDVSLKS
ncbi:hypothetical protein [Geitlerinema calcuttense]|nr:hypothetical protein [Geitlerinema calcuttense]